MKRLLLAGMALIITAAAPAEAAARTAADAAKEQAARPATDYGKLFDALWETVNRHFYDPTMRGVDFKAVKARYRPLVSEVKDDVQFQALGTRMIRELGTSHLDVIRPLGPESQGAAPGRYMRLNGKHYVIEGGEGLRVGDEVVDRSGLNGAVGSKGRVHVRGCDGQAREAEVSYEARSVPFHQWKLLSSRDGRRIGYFRIDRFNDDTMALTDKAMAELADTDGLIIDVRNNSGGSTSSLYVANWFMSGSQPAFLMLSRSQLKKLGREPSAADVAAAPKIKGVYRMRDVGVALLMRGMRGVFWTEGRGESGYTRPVAVLIGERTGSAAEGFGWMMKQGSSAKLIGRRTAGALLRGDTFKLPYGWQVNVPVMGLWGAGGESYADRPVPPDIPVAFTQAELCAGGDPDIAAALDYLGSAARR